MVEKTIRTSLDIPAALHRRLHEAAARKGCSARRLILESIERAVEKAMPRQSPRRLSLDPPLVPDSGRKPLPDADVYDCIEFP